MRASQPLPHQWLNWLLIPISASTHNDKIFAHNPPEGTSCFVGAWFSPAWEAEFMRHCGRTSAFAVKVKTISLGCVPPTAGTVSKRSAHYSLIPQHVDRYYALKVITARDMNARQKKHTTREKEEDNEKAKKSVEYSPHERWRLRKVLG